MAFNQSFYNHGFYNLFLAVALIVGLTLVLTGTGSMAPAGLVLLASSRFTLMPETARAEHAVGDQLVAGATGLAQVTASPSDSGMTSADFATGPSAGAEVARSGGMRAARLNELEVARIGSGAIIRAGTSTSEGTLAGSESTRPPLGLSTGCHHDRHRREWG